MSYSDKINKYINTKAKAVKFLTKAKYLTKDFKVPLYTGSEEDIKPNMTPQDKFKFSKLDNNSSYQKIWEKIMDSDSSSEEKTNTRRTLNNAYNNPILRKNMSQKELAYINKLPKKEVVEEKKPVEATYIPTEQREDVTAIVKRMADAKLKEEQDNWKKSFGNGGIPSLLKP